MSHIRAGIVFAVVLGTTGLSGCDRGGRTPASAAGDPATAIPGLSADGIGPFTLGRPLRDAASEALRFDPAAANIGPGCDERDQVSVNLDVGPLSLAVMSMAAADGRIEELIAIPAGAPPGATAADACQAAGASLARALGEELGDYIEAAPTMKAVSTEYAFLYPRGARVVARWFESGRSCDLALHFGAAAEI